LGILSKLIFIKMKKNREEWTSPEISDLGKAKDLVQNINFTGGGDTQFNVLLPS